jgi:hypothetical protein
MFYKHKKKRKTNITNKYKNIHFVLENLFYLPFLSVSF